MKFVAIEKVSPTHHREIGYYGFWRLLMALNNLRAQYGSRLSIRWC